MVAPPVSLPVPDAGMIMRIPHATVTRSVIMRQARYHLGAVYDAGGALVRESLRFPDKHRPRDPQFLASAREQGLTIERRIKRALYLGHAFTHFGHFLIETVPAFYWTQYVDPDVALLFHPFDENGRNVFTDFLHGRECLALLGVPPDRIVMATADLEVEELLLPPRHYNMRAGPRYDFREVYRTLAAAVRPSRTEPGATRIYLSRRLLPKPRLRRVLNEAALERQVARRGFTILHPQRMSLAEQINAVSAADLVAGIDGSALHLSAFMRPGSRMLVLQTKRRRTVLFMNTLMEVETVAVPARRIAGKRLAEVDLAAVDQALDGLGCPPAPRFFRRILDSVLR